MHIIIIIIVIIIIIIIIIEPDAAAPGQGVEAAREGQTVELDVRRDEVDVLSSDELDVRRDGTRSRLNSDESDESFQMKAMKAMKSMNSISGAMKSTSGACQTSLSFRFAIRFLYYTKQNMMFI